MKIHAGLAARRLAIVASVGAATLVVALAVGGSWPVAVSFGWDAAAFVFLIWVWATIGAMDAQATERHAQAEDASRAAADAILLSASVSSLVAIAFDLVEAGHRTGWGKGLLIGLAVLSVALAWSAVHTVYTLRYGSLYYTSPVGDIDYHDNERPDYHDLAYVALTIGMTYQVSDTDIVSKPMRRTALRHALLSFVFGVVIVAITINIVASLLSK